MTTAVYIDSCAWNYLFDAQVAMSDLFPSSQCRLFITREVEIELAAIPDDGKDGSDKRALKRFIRESIAENRVQTTGFFGFRSVDKEGNPVPIEHETRLGFGQGSFQSEQDRAWYADPQVQRHLSGSPKKSGLTHNQADASLGARAFDAIILTNEKKDKPGPLLLATAQAGRVLYLGDFQASGLSLEEFVARAIAPRDE